MVTFTHIEIAATVLKTVERELSVRLDRAGFIYGSIKPDISPALVKILHFKEFSYEFVKQEITELMQYRFDESTKCTRKFSERLGVVIHYLADYFCYAHSTHFKGNMFSHLTYEMMLSAYWRLNPKKTKAGMAPDKVYLFTDYPALCSHIEKLHNGYMARKPSYDLDLAYTLRICTTLCLSVIASCTKKQLGLAA